MWELSGSKNEIPYMIRFYESDAPERKEFFVILVIAYMMRLQKNLNYVQSYINSLWGIKTLENNYFSYYATFLPTLRLFTFLIVPCFTVLRLLL